MADDASSEPELASVILLVGATGLPAGPKYHVQIAAFNEEDPEDPWVEIAKTEDLEGPDCEFDVGGSLLYCFSRPQYLLFRVCNASELDEDGDPLSVGDVSTSVGALASMGAESTFPIPGAEEGDPAVGKLNIVFDMSVPTMIPDGTDEGGETKEEDMEDFMDFNTWKRTLPMRARMIQKTEVVESVALAMASSDIPQGDLFGKADPYLCIYKPGPLGERVLVLQTEVIMNTLNPEWLPKVVTVEALCSGDMDAKLTFELFDWNKHSAPDYLGTIADVTPTELLSEPTLPWSRPGYGVKGVLEITECAIVKEEVKRRVPKSPEDFDEEYKAAREAYGFKRQSKRESQAHPEARMLRHIHGGCKLVFNFGIDMASADGAASTGPDDHVKPPMAEDGESFEYEGVYHALAQIYEEYQGRIVHAYGFNASFPKNRMKDNTHALKVFPLGLTKKDLPMGSMSEFYTLYRAGVEHLLPSGGVDFTRFIDKICASVKPMTQENQVYQVCTILTQSAPDNVRETVEKLAKAAELPISWVIIRVGPPLVDPLKNALPDTGNEAIDWAGITAKRPNVVYAQSRLCGDDLRLATLGWVPYHFAAYCAMSEIAPNLAEDRLDLDLPPPPLPPPPPEDMGERGAELVAAALAGKLLDEGPAPGGGGPATPRTPRTPRSPRKFKREASFIIRVKDGE